MLLFCLVYINTMTFIILMVDDWWFCTNAKQKIILCRNACSIAALAFFRDGIWNKLFVIQTEVTVTLLLLTASLSFNGKSCKHYLLSQAASNITFSLRLQHWWFLTIVLWLRHELIIIVSARNGHLYLSPSVHSYSLTSPPSFNGTVQWTLQPFFQRSSATQ